MTASTEPLTRMDVTHAIAQEWDAHRTAAHRAGHGPGYDALTGQIRDLKAQLRTDTTGDVLAQLWATVRLRNQLGCIACDEAAAVPGDEFCPPCRAAVDVEYADLAGAPGAG